MTKNLSQSLNQSQSSELFQLSSHICNYHQYTPHNDQHSGNGTRRRQNRRWSRISGFHEEYQLSTRNLGQGSCGLVLRCLHRRGNLEYAVKMIRKDRVPRNRVLEECDKYFVQIAEASQFMHYKGVAHRDLNPANILCVHNLPSKYAVFQNT